MSKKRRKIYTWINLIQDTIKTSCAHITDKKCYIKPFVLLHVHITNLKIYITLHGQDIQNIRFFIIFLASTSYISEMKKLWVYF